ncbi:MAG: Fic family protein [Clostridia bacterium]|nr:Fic family protein [Clostridia bacterium]
MSTHAGCFRSGNVGVFNGDQLIHAGTPAAYVPEVMRQLFAWLQSTTVHPLIKGCVFHFEFEYIHPFSDGNGRTGRLWHSLILQQWRPILSWLPVESLVHEHQEEYYHTLNIGQHNGEATDFAAFMLRMLRDTLMEINEDQRHHDVDNDIDNGVDNGVNDVVEHQDRIAQSVLMILKKRPKSSAREIGELIALSTRQTQRILSELQAEGLLIRHGSPRSGYWEVI